MKRLQRTAIEAIQPVSGNEPKQTGNGQKPAPRYEPLYAANRYASISEAYFAMISGAAMYTMI